MTYTGKALNDVVAFRWEDLIHPDDLETTTQAWFSSVKSGSPHQVQHRLRRADGSYRWFQENGAPLRDDKGQIVHWFSLDVDIDDEQSGGRARQARARLSRATQFAAVAELSASIAHEINQPLASVVANGHACQTWLSDNPPNVERARLTAERIIRDGNSAAEVVQRIRALFKQAAPAMVLSNINDVVLAVLKLIGGRLRDSGVSVETDLAAGLPMIVVDRVQIQRTLINLAHNAIEAMEGVTIGPNFVAHFTVRRRRYPGPDPRQRLRHSKSSVDLRPVLHHQRKRDGDGPGDLPLDRRDCTAGVSGQPRTRTPERPSALLCLASGRVAMTRTSGVVYLVDDDSRVREALSELLASLGIEHVTFGSAAEYLGLCKVGRLRLSGTGRANAGNNRPRSATTACGRIQSPGHFYQRSWRHPIDRPRNEGGSYRIPDQAHRSASTRGSDPGGIYQGPGTAAEDGGARGLQRRFASSHPGNGKSFRSSPAGC